MANMIGRKEAVGMEELISRYIREMKIASGVNRMRVQEAWNTVSGAARYTLSVSYVGAVVYVIVKAAKKAAPVTMAAKKEPCEFGKANHEFSHDANRRLSQLEGFYKDGIIDRKEYELLKRRWSKN